MDILNTRETEQKQQPVELLKWIPKNPLGCLFSGHFQPWVLTPHCGSWDLLPLALDAYQERILIISSPTEKKNTHIHIIS